MFKRAERKKAKLRLALLGPSGSGKTYSALQIASGMGGRIAMIDTENGSGELYAHLCEYDVCQILPPFDPQKYVEAIHEAERAGYDIIVIDSLSHAWAGSGGLLEQVDKRKGAGNSFAAWRDITPMHNQFVDAMVQSSAHIIATMRTKTGYEMQKDDRGKVVPVKVGLQPVQRDGLEFEFTTVLDMDMDRHMAHASKDRTSLFDGQWWTPSPDTGKQLMAWLESGLDPDAAIIKEAASMIAACSTVTGLRGLWQREAGRWQTRQKAFAQISELVAAKDAELKATQDAPASPTGIPDMPTEYDQQSGQTDDEFEPGSGGMGDPIPSDEREYYNDNGAEREVPPMSDSQRKAIMAYFNKCGMAYSSNKDAVLASLSNFFEVPVPFQSIKDLNAEMAGQFLSAINNENGQEAA